MLKKMVFILSILLVSQVCLIYSQDKGNSDSSENRNTGEEVSKKKKSPKENAEVITAPIVVVTGTRTEKKLSDTPVVTEIITEKEIEESRAESFADVLEDYGVQQGSNQMGSQIYMQGLGGKRVSILVNGKKMTGRLAGNFVTDAIPVANIERVEIVRGPMSGLYGSDAIGGVINIITKKPSGDLSAKIKLTNSITRTDEFKDFFWGQDVQASLDFGINDNISGRINGSYSGTDDFYDKDNPYPADTAAYDSVSGGVEFDFNFSENIYTDVGGSINYKKSKQAKSLQFEEIIPILNTEEFVDFGLTLGDNASLLSRTYHHYYLRKSRSHNVIKDTNTPTRKTEENEITTELIYNHDLSYNNLLTLVASCSFDQIYKYNLRNENEGEEAGGTRFADSQALAVQDEIYKEDVYSVILGLRGERHKSYGYFLAPKASGMYHLNENLLIRTGVGVGYRSPDFSDLYLLHGDGVTHPKIMGNPDLDPEIAIGENIGLEYSNNDLDIPVLKSIYLMFNLYRTDLWKEIQEECIYIDESIGYSEWEYVNIAESSRMGIDTEFAFALTNFFNISGGYNYVYAYDKTLKRQMLSVPEHTARAKFQVNVDSIGLTAYLMAKYTAEMLFVAMGSSEEGSIMVDKKTNMDFYTGKNINDNYKIFAGISNITNKTNKDMGPFLGRKFYFGINAEF